MIREVDDPRIDLPSNDSPGESVPRASVADSLIVAIQFLTRLPIGSAAAASPRALRRAPLFFPLVGAAIGVGTATAIHCGMLVWPVSLAVLVAFAIEARWTGALHEDALADFCDAFGGGWTRDEVLEILKDSRIGTYGALGLIIGFAIRALATISVVSHYGLDKPWIWGSIVVASAAIGRLAMCFAMYFVPPVPRRASLARDMGERLSFGNLFIATILVSPLIAWFAYLLPLAFAAAVVMVVTSVAWMLIRIQRRIGGITGDCLGFVCYVAQVLVLLAGAVRPEFWSRIP